MLRSAYLSLVIGVLFASSVLAQSTGMAEDSRSGAPEPTSEVYTEALRYEEYLELYGVDLNEDGQVDETDYKLWLENPFIGIAKDEIPVDDPFSYEDYLKIYGIDLNEDGQVDETDYRLWLENPFIGIPGDETPKDDSFSYEDYLRIYGIDLNEDGRVDEADYELWQEDPFRGDSIPAAVSSQSWGAIKKAASR